MGHFNQLFWIDFSTALIILMLIAGTAFSVFGLTQGLLFIVKGIE